MGITMDKKFVAKELLAVAKDLMAAEGSVKIKREIPNPFSNPKLKVRLVGTIDGWSIDIPFERKSEAKSFAEQRGWNLI